MWTLLLARIGDAPGAFVDRRRFDGGQIKIGRNVKTCDWVLPDEHGHISREHCTVSAIGLDLFVVDTSTNGISLNTAGQRIAPQVPVAIRVNDRLLLGDYAIEVATESAGAGMALRPAAPPPLPVSNGFGTPDAWFDAPVDPVWGNSARDAEVHEFLGSAMHDFLGGPSARAPTGPPIDPAWGGAMASAFAKPILSELLTPVSDFGIPEDWAAPLTKLGASDGAGPMPERPVEPSADPFARSLPPASDPFAEFAARDPFAMPGFNAAVPADIDPFALPVAAPVAFAVVPPLATPMAPKPAAAKPTPGAADAPDWAAFCAGAGLEADELRLSPDAMHRLGVMYRQVVLGLSDLIQDRAAFKDEFRVERTQLSIGRNNPLKHLPPLDSAKVLLGESLPGFMATDEAVRAAFEDIKKHQLAMLAGVQHALNAVFERLAPAEIDRLITKAAGDKRGLRFTRGINPWTVYQTVFEALRRDATANVNSVMSMAFRDGYEKFLKSGH